MYSENGLDVQNTFWLINVLSHWRAECNASGSQYAATEEYIFQSMIQRNRGEYELVSR